MPTGDPCLAAEKVGSSEDNVTEILLRLPVRSLILFKSVSKQWYSLITNNPCFKNPNKPPDPPSGLFVQTSTGYAFVPFDIHIPVKFPTLCCTVSHIEFKSSCNGLILCGNFIISLSDDIVVTDENYVYNPTTNQSIRLPIPYNGKHVWGMSIAFDPLKSPHYKVVSVFDDFDRVSRAVHKYQIHVYSSKTRTCKLSYNLTITRYSQMMFETGVYWNNAIHWIDKVGFIVYFDLDQEMTHEIKAPFARRGLDYENYVCYIFESRNQLLLVEFYCPLITKFKVHGLKRDYSDWSVKYLVDFEEFGGLSFPKSLNLLPNQYYYLFELYALSLVLGSGDDDDDESFLLVEISGNIVRLNLESKTYHEFGKISDRRSYDRPELYQSPNVYKFAASLYNLTYDKKNKPQLLMHIHGGCTAKNCSGYITTSYECREFMCVCADQQANFARPVASLIKAQAIKVARFLPNPESYRGPKLRAGSMGRKKKKKMYFR
ncbi:F-box protein At5g07610-like [Rutidosis leptorrhynchoides]|uniref:F-box protein At5g07610-like n=1 Tax=Rutidosis leptorrhynchoides TaxID=125765 RepID=UPI003A98F112